MTLRRTANTGDVIIGPAAPANEPRTLFLVTGVPKASPPRPRVFYVASAVVPVGRRPWGIAVTPDGRKIYTANGVGRNVSVIDAATLKVVAAIPAGDGAWGVAISPR